MSEPAAAEPHTSIDNQAELEALVRMLRLAEGFTLAFARSNHASQRERLTAELKRRLPGREICSLRLDSDRPAAVVSQLEAATEERDADALLVDGLDDLIDPTARQSPALEALNLNRNHLARRFPFPLVFWLGDSALRELPRRAPDLWSWRSGSYHFVGEEEDRSSSLTETPADLRWAVPPAQRRRRREALEAMLLEANQQSLEGHEVARLRQLLADALSFEARYEEAAQLYAQALALFRSLGDRLGEAQCLQSQGEVARMQARYEEAAQLYAQALALFRSLGDRLGEASSLLSMGRLANAQGAQGSAREAFALAEGLFQEIGLPFWASVAAAEKPPSVPPENQR
ncbi:MAG: tetratricopeptide repeat protein [Thermoanaerobaculia bacterium]